jgi:hypothetical protein
MVKTVAGSEKSNVPGLNKKEKQANFRRHLQVTICLGRVQKGLIFQILQFGKFIFF